MFLASALVSLSPIIPVAHAEAPTSPKTAAVGVLVSKSDIEAYIDQKALETGISASKVKAVINCESAWNPRAVGDKNTSFGLSQIHLPAHPEVTIAQAEDPKFAVDFMFTEWARGNARAWTCARILGYAR